MKCRTFLPLAACLLGSGLSNAQVQVNSGSDGRDGRLEPGSNVTLDMADHPDGVYQFTSVNIPSGFVVFFIPNSKNTPVIWLAQGKVVIAGTVVVSGKNGGQGVVGIGGPGGYGGGNGGAGNLDPTDGLGPGGGGASVANTGSSAGFGTPGVGGPRPGQPYGNALLLPLVGGSGGGGGGSSFGGGGGGGAILIASSDSISIDGSVESVGGERGFAGAPYSGAGSGGGIRLVANRISGKGSLNARGGTGAGNGRVRLDCFDNQFSGSIVGENSVGFQPIILPAAGNGVTLSILSVGGVAVPAKPTGAIGSPDLMIPGQQVNPIPVVVRCSNIPLNTDITVEVKPANAAAVVAVGKNGTGTQASSTATVSVNIPRGGGIIYASAVTGIVSPVTAALNKGARFLPVAQTGLTTDGERFTGVEVKVAAGGKQTTTYITESGKQLPAPAK